MCIIKVSARACLKKGFLQDGVTICGNPDFARQPDEIYRKVVAGYDNRITGETILQLDLRIAKWGVQIAGMIFQKAQ